MNGDGVNDAPTMANSTVGLRRAARSIIRQNLWASLGMVAILIPATILGFAGIGVAVALHEGSTLLVVANALTLLAYLRPRACAESSLVLARRRALIQGDDG
jgi:cation transport ATPase